PATPTIDRASIRCGFTLIFLDAGCIDPTPTCRPGLGGHMGCLAAVERAVSTTNRNFVGRLRHVTSEVYLASPAVAAASSIAGHLCHPEEVMNK
uniref:aconitase family protein n=1 Tax=Oscillibacter sp. TaxID=1945593 RepID=UPI00289FDF42